MEEPLGGAPIQAYTFDGKPITFRPKVKKAKLNPSVRPGLYILCKYLTPGPVVNVTRDDQQDVGCTNSQAYGKPI